MEYEASVFAHGDAYPISDVRNAYLIATSTLNHNFTKNGSTNQFLRSKSLFKHDSSHVRPNVLNSSECGYLIFIALMNLHRQVGRADPELFHSGHTVAQI